MRIAVTGSTGFIGRNLMSRLHNQGYDVLEISRSKGVYLDKWDSVKDLQPCDTIIHLAAKTFVPDSFNDTRDFYHVNQTLTLNAMELAKKWKAKIIHMSSYLYGPPQYLPVDEQHSLNPHNPYAQTKLISENIVQGYARDFSLKGVMFRIFNIYGPDQDASFLIPTILNQVKAGKVILKDPRPKRDFIHVEDVVNGILKAVKIDFDKLEVLNFGSGESKSVSEIVDFFKKHSQKPFSIQYTHEYRQGEIMDSLSCNKKLESVLQWSPDVNIEQGISQLL